MKKEKHKKYLIDLLSAIYQNQFLAHNLYFKGGTALFLFHELPRFSTDLDFDLRAGCKDKEQVKDEVKKIASKFGTVRESVLKRHTIFLLLSYEKYERTIKIEINTRNPILQEYEVKNIFGVDVKVLSLELITAQKLLALQERKKARDLFDAYFILVNELPLSEDLIKGYTGKTMGIFWDELAKKVQKEFSSKTILHELGEMIEEKKKNWVKEKLKDEVLILIENKKRAHRA